MNNNSSTDFVQKMILKIDWARAVNRYVIVDPNTSTTLLYVSEGRYLKLISSQQEDMKYQVLAVPRDSLESCLERHGYSDPSKKSEGGNSLSWRAKLSRLFTLQPGWVLSDSMIKFKRNFEQFHPIYYLSITSWLGMTNTLAGYISAKRFGHSMTRIFRCRGINQVIIILKISSIAVNHYISGNPLVSTQSLGQRVSLIHGLPKWLPKYFRDGIRSEQTNLIRLIVSLLASYKGFAGTWKTPSFDTITSPKFFREAYEKIHQYPILHGPWKLRDDGSDDSEAIEDWREVKNNLPGFYNFINPGKIKFIPSDDLSTYPMPYTAGPNCSTSYLGAMADALAHLAIDPNRRLYNFGRYLKAYSESIGIPMTITVFDVMMNMVSDFKRSFNFGATFDLDYFSSLSSLKGKDKAEKIYDLPYPLTYKMVLEKIAPDLILGKLATKLEPAGKVRVFAIVDYWTQWMLEPLHKSLFEILKRVSSDATFDQTGKVEMFANKGYTFVASFDLKSATDMIPIRLYVEVLAHWIGRDLARAWADLLTDRDYYSFSRNEDGTKSFKKYQYSRGQPMGALSSWASMALVHHFIVYLASVRAGKYNFRDYLVLGDDIVIADKDVADKYLIMCASYGIQVGIPKSYISEKGFFQFASQELIGKTNLSPFSLKEVIRLSGNSYYFGPDFNLSSRLEWAFRALRKGFLQPPILSKLIRVTSSHFEWKRYSKFLSRGIVPQEVRNLVVAFMLSGSTPNNILSMDSLMASIRGDIGVFTQTVHTNIKEEKGVLSIFLTSLVRDVEKDIEKINSSLIEYPLTLTYWLQIYSAILMTNVNAEKRDQVRDAYERFENLLARCPGDYLDPSLDLDWFYFTDTDKVPRLNLEFIQELIVLAREVKAVSAKAGWAKAALVEPPLRPPAKVRMMMSSWRELVTVPSGRT